MSKTKTKDLSKLDYEKYGNLIGSDGKLLGETTYAIPIETKLMLDAKGQQQIEVTKITFEQGTHIEDVRREMNGYADRAKLGIRNDELWIHLGFYELLPDALFRQLVTVKDKLR